MGMWELQLSNLELAVSLAKRGNLPGADNLVVTFYLTLFEDLCKVYSSNFKWNAFYDFLMTFLFKRLTLMRYLYIFGATQVVQRFQELFSEQKYTEAAELAAESPQGILRTPETIAKFRVCWKSSIFFHTKLQEKRCNSL